MPTNKKIGVIDLGTNTFHLLVVEVVNDTYRILFKDKVPVKIGEGGIDDNIISEYSLERALNTLTEFKNTLSEYDVESIKATATSAFRNATNVNYVKDRIKQLTDIDVQVISGELEAQLIYEGVKQAVTLEDEKSLIMDIGGGSVEFVICNKYQVFWKYSFEIGGLRLMNKFHREDPISDDSLRALQSFLRAKLHRLNVATAIHKPKTLIGASGSFDTLCEIYHKRDNIVFDIEQEEQTEFNLPLNVFHEINEDIISKDREQRLEIPGMIAMRVDMIVVACSLIEYVISIIDIENIKSSTFALKEGLLRRFIKKEPIS